MDPIRGPRLDLVPDGPERLGAFLAGAEFYRERFGLGVAEGLADFAAQAPPAHWDRLLALKEPTLWDFGFSMVHPADALVVGMCGFKGPPDGDGAVEIAYAVAPAYQGRGFATEAVGLAVEGLRSVAGVAVVRAHTLPEANASTRVLEKNAFQKVGPVEDPEDGLVWRWERSLR